MAIYFMVEVLHVKDESTYRRYTEAARFIIGQCGGEYIIQSNEVSLVSGALKPERIVLIRFPDEQTMKTCFNSSEYGKITPLRERSVEARAYIIRA